MKPDDIIRWDDGGGYPHLWRVLGVHFGAMGQESLIQLENISHKPGSSGEWEIHVMMFVPECLLRNTGKIQIIEVGHL
jgi:hypothetical protein